MIMILAQILIVIALLIGASYCFAKVMRGSLGYVIPLMFVAAVYALIILLLVEQNERLHKEVKNVNKYEQVTETFYRKTK